MRRSEAMAFAVALGSLVWLGSCSDGGPRCDDPTGPDCPSVDEGVILSDPAPGDAGSLALQRALRGLAFSFSAQAAPGETDVAYISLPSGSYPGGALARITSSRFEGTVTAPMIEGGLDPVPVTATAGDSVEIEILSSDAAQQLRRGRAAVRPRGTAVPARGRTPLSLLHEYLIAPPETAGALAGARRLIIVPHAELHYLPFAALIQRRERETFLIERYDIGYAPSASVWMRLGERLTPRASGVLALAPRSAALPGSREEVEAIRALYGRQAMVLTNGAASEAAFRAAAPRYGVVHLATYGVLNKHNPLFSYVALNPGGDVDGRLEVHEVFGLELRARLLVLSACQTALASGIVSDVPAGDDWVGLVRAFLGVGAANVIATLWPVEDRATAKVMELLYRRIRAGDTELAALSATQRDALRSPATADPFYWAGFVLVGGR